MKNTTLLIGIVLMMVLVTIVSVQGGAQIDYESATVSRVMGENAFHTTNLLDKTVISPKGALYYTNEDHGDSEFKADVLDERFNSNVDYEYDNIGFSWEWNDLIDEIENFYSSHIVVIEAEGNVVNNQIESYAVGGGKDLTSDNMWLKSKYLSLLVFNSDYAGLFLPKEDSLIASSLQTSQIIAPTAIPDNAFVEVLLCNLGRTESLGKDYRKARNNYYWQTSSPSGLALLSYQLIGNPLVKVKLPSNFAIYDCLDFEKEYDSLDIQKNYKIYKNSGFGTQEIKYDLYTYEATLTIEDYEVASVSDDLEVIEIKGFTQAYDENYPILPRRVEQLALPLKTVVTNVSILERNNLVEINANIASWDEEFVERLCAENSYDATVKEAHSFTEEYEVVLIEINPVEVVDCEAGLFKLYQEIKYIVEYLPNSAVVLESITYPEVKTPGSNAHVDIAFTRVKTEAVNGTIRISDENGVVVEKNVNFDQDQFVTSVNFDAPLEEGLFTYTVEWVENSEVTSRTSFEIYVALIDAFLKIPSFIEDEATVNIELYNFENVAREIMLLSSLAHENEVKKSDSVSLTLNPGWNLHSLEFTNLLKEDAHYDLDVDLVYDGFKKSLNGQLITNHKPILKILPDMSVKEGELVEITPTGIDHDYDTLTYSISEPIGDDGIWVPPFDAQDNYTITVSLSDGYLITTQDFIIEVIDVSPDPQQVIFRDCNYGLYRGGLAEVSLYDPHNDTLYSWYQTTQYDEVAVAFAQQTYENWTIGTCASYDGICIDDSDIGDPSWGDTDTYPDPVFEKGGTCETTNTPLVMYKGHEVCQGNIECEYPLCEQSSDCGETKWVGEKYCQDNSVYLNQRVFSCLMAGTYEASCNQEDVPVLLEQCSAQQECYQGSCVQITCNQDSDCGNAFDVDSFCTAQGVMKTHRTFTCENKGSAQSECVAHDDEQFISSCDVLSQICLSGQCIEKDNFLVNIFDDGSQDKTFTFYEQSQKTIYVQIPKDVEVKNTSIHVTGGTQ